MQLNEVLAVTIETVIGLQRTRFVRQVAARGAAEQQQVHRFLLVRVQEVVLNRSRRRARRVARLRATAAERTCAGVHAADVVTGHVPHLLIDLAEA